MDTQSPLCRWIPNAIFFKVVWALKSEEQLSGCSLFGSWVPGFPVCQDDCPLCSWLSGPWVHWGGDECSELFVVEEKLIGQHFHEVRHDINYMLLLCIFLFCTGLSLQSKPEQSLKEQQGDRGAARMARKRHWLLEFWQKSVQGSKKYLNWKKILQFFWSQVWWMVARRQTTWRVRCFIIFTIATTIYIVIM